ncbi:MAG: NAD(P)-dependent alcohol dehydrogenase [Leptospiraceae bacterium]|nr:NAD(P)-dependent alcohol dehydrogenase [Leptospiraceae bacterium]
MKAVLYDKKSLPEKLKYCEIEKPLPKENEILVKIFATSINAADYRSMKAGIIPKSKIFGADIAGVVESVGKNISRFKPGDEVIGDLSNHGFGGFAEYAVAPEETLVFKPENISFEEAGALPLAGITALQALRDEGKIQKDQKVLIVGGSGGVGTFAVQLAKHFGATVTCVCSSKNVEEMKILGADDVIDYAKDSFLKNIGVYDLILAVNGNYSLSSYKKCLKEKGRCVLVGGALVQVIKALLFGKFLSLGGKKIRSLYAKSNSRDLDFLAKLTSEKKIRPVIEKIYPLEKTPEAMHSVSEGHARGKVIIKVNSLCFDKFFV